MFLFVVTPYTYLEMGAMESFCVEDNSSADAKHLIPSVTAPQMQASALHLKEENCYTLRTIPQSPSVTAPQKRLRF